MNSNTTEPPNALHRLIGEKDVYITLEQYQEEQTNLFERLLNASFETKKIDEEDYRDLLGRVQTFSNWELAFEHFATIFNDLVDALQSNLQKRIIKGAEYMESIGKEHQNYEAAMKRYDLLCEELYKSKKR